MYKRQLRAATAVHTPEVTVPRADETTGGGSCRQQDVPLKGAEAVVTAPHADPVTGPACARTALPHSEIPPAGAERAPPAPAARGIGPLPVLRI